MANYKEEYVNRLLFKMIDVLSSEQLKLLKNCANTLLYEYSIEKIQATEITAVNGETTERLMRFVKIGYLSSGKSEKTVEQYEIVVKQLCDMIPKELNMMTEEDIIRFLCEYKHIHKVKDTTMENKRKFLSAVFKYLYKHKKISNNPMECIEELKVKQTVKQPLSDEEIEKIRIAASSNKRDMAMISFFLDTGVRVSELSSISLADIDFRNYQCKILGKGNKERIVSFSGNCAIRLQEYLQTRNDLKNNTYKLDTPLFSSTRGCKKISPRTIELNIKKIGIKSGVFRIHPHLLRATFATNLARKGVDINIISLLLGHSNLNTVKKYVLLDNYKIDTAIRNVGFAV